MIQLAAAVDRKRPEKIDTVKIIFDGDSGGIQKTTIVAADNKYTR